MMDAVTSALQVRIVAGILLLALVLLMPSVRATGVDLHWLWDDRCATCHGHAGEFTRRFLSVSSGMLQGPHHVHDLHRFLHNHYLATGEVDAVYNMLLAQANSQARFREECVSCHDTAARFVRDSLELRDGLLYGRNTKIEVSQFLDHHRKLSPDDAEFFTALLTRVAHEVYRPEHSVGK